MTRFGRTPLLTVTVLLLMALVATNCAPTPTVPAGSGSGATAQPASLPDKEKVKIAFAHVGPISDEGWTYTHHLGALAIKEAFPDRVEIVEVESMPYSEEASRILEQFVADGAKMIFITSEYADFVYKVAEAHPDVVFLECNGNKTTNNLVYYYFPNWKVGYAAGVAAGLLSKTGQLGHIGSFPLPSNYANTNSFALGAQSVNPNAVTHGVLVNSWFDPPAETQATEALINGGVDVTFGYMDDPAYLQVSEKRGVWTIAGSIDLRKYAPEWYVTSVMHNWNSTYIKEVGDFLDGKWKGNRWFLVPTGDDGYHLDKWGKNVPKDVQEKVQAVYEKILAGEPPIVGPIYDMNGTLRIKEGEVPSDEFFYRGWNWPVKGVVGMPMP